MRPRVRLIWVVRSREVFGIFQTQLRNLANTNRDDITIRLYETK